MSLLRLCKRKQPSDSLSLSDDLIGSEISDTSIRFCTAQSDDLRDDSYSEVQVSNLASMEACQEICADQKLQDDMNDSLNAVTDRINLLELGFSDQSEQLREELILFKQSVKYILSELLESLRVLLARSPPRFAQSRTGMRRPRDLILSKPRDC